MTHEAVNLGQAVADGDRDTVVAALSRGTASFDRVYHLNVDSRQRWTLLGLATWLEYPDVAREILKSGSPPDAPTGPWWETPLHFAAASGDAELVALLVQYGADLEARDRSHKRPLASAAERGHLAAVEALLSAGADANAECGFEQVSKEVRNAINSPTTITEIEILHEPFRRGNTALMKAAFYGHGDVVRALMRTGCDVTAANAKGNTALHLAAQQGHVDILRGLLATTKCRIDARNADGDTALLMAVKSLFMNPWMSLLQTGRRDREDKPIASLHGALECAELLLDHGGDVHVISNTKENALHQLLTGEVTSTEISLDARFSLIIQVLQCTVSFQTEALPSDEQVAGSLKQAAPDILAQLRHLAGKPRTLQHLTTCFIRARLSVSRCAADRERGVHKLPLPLLLKQRLLLKR